MNNVLIVYGYNNKNLGDDLMFASIINNTNYERYFFYGNQTQPEFVSKKVEFIKYGRALPLRWKFKADFAVIGGSVVMGKEDKHFNMIRQKVRFCILNKIFGGHNFIVGANLGPYRDKSEYLGYLKSLNAWVDKWLLRDSFSHSLIAETGTKKSIKMPDIVMGFPVDKYKSIKSEKCVSISVTKVEKDGKGNISSTPYIDEIKQWVSFYIALGYTIEFVSFEDSVDLEVINLILNRVNNEYLDKIKVVKYNKDDVLISLAKAEIVISTRFHSMVLAALLDKKQVIYSYSDKTSNFAKDYGFIVHPVTGVIEGKSAYQTTFEQSDIDLAKNYPKLLMSK